MKLMLFTVLDKAVGAFMQPFYVRSRGEALRSFSEAVNDEKHQFNKHAADYTLFACGEFDDQTGIVSPAEPTRVVGAMEVMLDNPFTEETRIREVGPRVAM